MASSEEPELFELVADDFEPLAYQENFQNMDETQENFQNTHITQENFQNMNETQENFQSINETQENVQIINETQENVQNMDETPRVVVKFNDSIDLNNVGMNHIVTSPNTVKVGSDRRNIVFLCSTPPSSSPNSMIPTSAATPSIVSIQRIVKQPPSPRSLLTPALQNTPTLNQQRPVLQDTPTIMQQRLVPNPGYNRRPVLQDTPRIIQGRLGVGGLLVSPGSILRPVLQNTPTIIQQRLVSCPGSIVRPVLQTASTLNQQRPVLKTTSLLNQQRPVITSVVSANKPALQTVTVQKPRPEVQRPTPRPITFAKDIEGLKKPPTILLQNVIPEEETFVTIEDATVELEPKQELAYPLRNCDINIQRNEVVTFTMAYLSAETLLPFEDDCKKKKLKGEDDESESSEEDYVDEVELQAEEEDWNNYVKNKSPFFFGANTKKRKLCMNSVTDLNGNGPEKKRKRDSSASKEIKCEIGEDSMAEEVGVKEMMELTEMIRDKTGDSDEHQKEKTVENGENMSAEDTNRQEASRDIEGSPQSSLPECAESGERELNKRDDEEMDSEDTVEDNEDIIKDNEDTIKDDEDTIKAKLNIKDTPKIKGRKNNQSASVTDADNVKRWLNKDIDEFDQTKDEGVVKDEEMLTDITFTQASLELYLSYMGRIDEENKPTQGPLVCEKCLKAFSGTVTLYNHLEASLTCKEMYVLLESATSAKDPEVVRKDLDGYMEVFGCYACSYMSHDAAEIRYHWLREHMEEGLYLCNYCLAEFHTSFRCALHILMYHPDKPLHVSMAPSPMYRKNIIFDLEGVRKELYQQAEVFVSPAMLKKEQSAVKMAEGGPIQSFDNCVLRCMRCSTQEIFAGPSELRAHINLYHRASMRSFRCSICSLKFAGQFDLRRHVAAAHQGFIGKTTLFSNFDDVKLAMMARLSHFSQVDRSLGLGSKEEPYVCVRCVQLKHPDISAFESQARLVVHYGQEHLGLTKINCLTCKETYNENGWCRSCQSRLDIAYRCYIDAFIATDMRRTTFNIAAGKTPQKVNLFVCSVCCFKTEDRAGILTHIKNAHAICRPYKCGHCNYSALELKRMKKHVIHFHKESVASEEQQEKSLMCRSSERGTVDFKAMLDDLAQSLLLTIPATDRSIILFEGDTTLNKTFEMEPEFNANETLVAEEESTIKSPTAESTKKKSKNPSNITAEGRQVIVDIERQNKQIQTKMKPRVIDGQLYLEMEEFVVLKEEELVKTEPDADSAAFRHSEELDEELINTTRGNRGTLHRLEVPEEKLGKEGVFYEFESLFSTTTGDRIGNPPNFKCHYCFFEVNKHAKLVEHLSLIHSTREMGDQGQYWQCFLCGYCAKDRSCMGRHVKYIHMTRRPHTCPYCDYSGIEKTKVRLHVKGNHSDQKLFVRTDQELSNIMSRAVKRYIYFVNGGFRYRTKKESVCWNRSAKVLNLTLQCVKDPPPSWSSQTTLLMSIKSTGDCASAKRTMCHL